MLNTPSDYEFVNVSDVGSFIHGEVLPARFSASSSSGKCATCNYEDYLYLLESYYERINYDQDGQNNITPANRTLSASYVRPLHWPYTVGYLAGSIGSGYYINPNSTIITSLTEISTFKITPEVVQNYQMGLSSNTYPYQYSPRSKSIRELELWGRFFWDYHRMTRLCFNCNSLTSVCSELPTGSGTSRSWYWDGNIQDYNYRDYPNSYSTYSSSIDFYVYTHANNPNPKGGETIAQFNWTFKPILKYMPHASSATFIALFQVYTNSATKYYAYPIPLTISNGNISLPNSTWINTVVQQILQINNVPYITSFQGHTVGVEDNTSIYMGSFYIIVDFDFPANYSSWNWQPT